MALSLRRAAAAAVAVALAFAFSGCSRNGDSGDDGVTKVDLLMNWFAQAEQGGYWQAAAEQLAKADGIELNVRQGGPQIQTIPQVAAGEAEFGIAQGDELLLARAEGAPVVLVFGGMDKYLQCMMFHPETNITDWPDLNGHRIAVAPSGGYWPYIKGRYQLDDVQEVNFTGSLANFAADKDLVQQCFITSEPYEAAQEGIEIGTLMVADSGYNPYSQGLFTTERMIREHPDVVRAVVKAVKEGWERFLADPTAGRELVLEVNKEMDAEKFDFAHNELATGDYFGEPLGLMEAQRWEQLAQQLRDAGVLTKEVDVNSVWTNEFHPDGS
ncbi:MAG: ABC transporter substrate-binding protein [Micromonosporaceae bacterium]|jgi:NitT/TauT family transport system substrate-binding protein